MNKLLYFGIGFAAGAAVGYFVVPKVVAKLTRYEVIEEEEEEENVGLLEDATEDSISDSSTDVSDIPDVRVHTDPVDVQLDETEGLVSDEVADAKIAEVEKKQEHKDPFFDEKERFMQELIEKNKQAKKGKYSIKHIDYDPIDEPYQDEIDAEIRQEMEDERTRKQAEKWYAEHGVDLSENEHPSEKDEFREPYGITYDEFCDDLAHEKVAINYYPDEEILEYDDTEECIFDDVSVLGYDWKQILEESEMPDSCYIRDDMNSIDYEIIVKKPDSHMVEA